MNINQQVRVTFGLMAGHTATIVALGNEENGHEDAVRLHFDKNDRGNAWADCWMNISRIEFVESGKGGMDHA